MKALFIWTVMVHGPSGGVRRADDSYTGAIRSMHVLKGLSREVVEISSSAACDGALIRFVQPHAMDMVRLLQHVERLEPAVEAGDPMDVVLDVTLLGVSRCVGSSCKEEDRPCRRYAQRDDSGICCLICPHDSRCDARHGPSTPLNGAFMRYRDLGMQAPVLIRRLLELSWAALPAAPEGSCEPGACAGSRYQSTGRDLVPAHFQGIST